MLAALRLPPGMAHAGTVYTTKNRWFRGNLIRFLEQTIRPVGGWAALTATGTPVEKLPPPAADPDRVGRATFAGPAQNLKGMAAEEGFGTWDYPGLVDSWQIEGSGFAKRSNAAGNNWAVGTGAVLHPPDECEIVLDLQRGVDGGGEGGGFLAFMQGLAVESGLKVTLNRIDATHVELYVRVLDATSTVLEGHSPHIVGNSSGVFPWATGEAKTLRCFYRKQQDASVAVEVTIEVGGVPVVTFDPQPIQFASTLVGTHFALYTQQGGSSSWFYNDVRVRRFTKGATVITTGPTGVVGKPRAAVSWLSTTGGQSYYAVGHTRGLLLYSEGVQHDITPVGFVPGLDDSVRSATSATRPYGSRFYGLESYGMGQPLQSRLLPADVWTLDIYGSGAMLIGVMAERSGRLYYYRPGVDTIAAEMVGAPLNNRSVVVTPESFVVALGAAGDPRLVYWADQATFDPTNAACWDRSDITRAAADYTLETPGQLMTGRRGRGETVLWTDRDVFAMIFVGGNEIYRFEKRGFQCGIVGPNAVAQADAIFCWMGDRAFHLYDGFARPLPCDVSDYVFSDFNYQQRIKVAAVVNPTFGEVTWYYPSASSNENDRYVTWNYRENHWATGLLDRACGSEAGNGFPNPLLVAPTGIVYQHELGTAMLDASAAPLTPFVESGPVELGDGDQFVHVLQLVPDERNQGDVLARFFTGNYPNAVETAHGPYGLGNPTDVRLNARAVRVRLDQARAGDWRVGTFRFDLRPGERR